MRYSEGMCSFSIRECVLCVCLELHMRDSAARRARACAPPMLLDLACGASAGSEQRLRRIRLVAAAVEAFPEDYVGGNAWSMGPFYYGAWGSIMCSKSCICIVVCMVGQCVVHGALRIRCAIRECILLVWLLLRVVWCGVACALSACGGGFTRAVCVAGVGYRENAALRV